MGKKLILNAPLSEKDVVICKEMDDFVTDHNGNKVYQGVPMGMRGEVDSVAIQGPYKQYNVVWQNGSRLGLIDVKECKNCGGANESNLDKCKNCGSNDLNHPDSWWKVVEESSPDLQENFKIKKHQIRESNEKLIYKFLNFANQYGNKKNILNNFLQVLKNSGFVNMLGAAPFLYMGKDEFKRQYHHRIKEIQNMKCDDLETDEEMESCENEKASLETLISLIDQVRNIMIDSAHKKLSKEKKYDVNNESDEFYRRLGAIITNDAKEYIKLWVQTSMFERF